MTDTIPGIPGPGPSRPTPAQVVSRCRAVFFDLFHTLFSFQSDGVPGRYTSDILGIPGEVWDKLVFDSSGDRLRGRVRDKYQIIRDLAWQYDPTIPESVILEAADNREARFTNGLKKVRSSTLETLATLKSRGKVIGLISNADSVEVAGWPESPLARYFDTVVFSYDVGYVKPEPEIYREAMSRVGVSAAEAVFVGDGGSNELKGARAVGLTTILTVEVVASRWPDQVSSRARHADHVITRLSQLLY